VASTRSHSFTYSFGLLYSIGQDATEAFEDVGHSDEARALLPGMLVGDFEQEDVSNHSIRVSYHSSYISLSGHQAKIRSCRCSGEASIWCCRAGFKVRLPFKPLPSVPLT